MHVGLLSDNFADLQLQQVSLKADDWKHAADTIFKQMACLKVTVR